MTTTVSNLRENPAGLASAVQYAKGVGPQRSSQLKRLGLETLEDLFTFYPRRYEDRAQLKPVSHIQLGKWETVFGQVMAVGFNRFRGRMSLVRVAVGDDSGIVYACWFNQPYMRTRFKVGDTLYLFGRLGLDRSKKPVIYNPEYEFVAPGEETIHMGRIVPIYPLTEGLAQRAIRSVMWNFLEHYSTEAKDDLPRDFVPPNAWMSKQEALRHIHFPSNMEMQGRARVFLAYEELFYFQLALASRKSERKQHPRGFTHDVRGPKMQAFLKSLPFTLTSAQQRVINQVRHDMAQNAPMNRLIEGDVGSGKTVVAAAAAMISLDSGHQTAFMVPTEILAEQHCRNLQKLLGALGVRIASLAGGNHDREKKNLLGKVAKGQIDILVGTHALIQDAVSFAKLGLVIVDEQHKFGVVQREKLRSKGTRPDVLVMTATPIPRTLALTLYGDLDTSTIDELPPGRPKITTYWISSKKLSDAYEFVRKEIRAGRQAYVVYPLVEESQKVSSKAVIHMAKDLSQKVFPEFRVGLVHGKLSGPEKDAVMQAFTAGKVQILVCTSVIEVGIDVANATCMLVENAERFGLAQLHQMRGRIGRGIYPSTFIMAGTPTTPEGQARMKVLRNKQDGFSIAEEDLKIRGPGEFFGIRQHGVPELRLASLVSDRDLLEIARDRAFSLVRKDPRFCQAAHGALGRTLRRRYRGLLEKISVG